MTPPEPIPVPCAREPLCGLGPTSTKKPLIYDIGMHNGDDSAYYLHCGYRVLAVEANPEFVRSANTRFARERAGMDLTILNVAMSETSTTREFWICEDTPEWSSFDLSIASRDEGRVHPITVQTVRLRDLISSYGVPEYLKIDIEKSDLICVNDLDSSCLPPYISVESECSGSQVMLEKVEYLASLNALYDKGYRRFKLVNQDTLIPVFPGQCNADMFSRESIDRFRSALEARYSWRFTHGCSGPWGESIESPWMSREEAETIYCLCREGFFATRAAPLYGFWFDWHATL